MKRSKMIHLMVSIKDVLPELRITKAEAGAILHNMEKAGMNPLHMKLKQGITYLNGNSGDRSNG